MPPATPLVLGSDHEVAEVGRSLLGRGNAVDAVVGGVFAAAGLHASVLLGPVQLLVGGAGAGLRAIDGRNRQPGLGNPRPRGFLPSESVPPASRVGVPGLPAALLAAATTYGKLSVAAVVGPGLDLARSRSPERGKVLSRIAQRGPAALAEAVLADELVASLGRLAGGILSVRDLAELRPVVTAAAASQAPDGRELFTVPWASEAAPGAPSLSGADTRVLVAVDRNGLLAVACYALASLRDGLSLDAMGLVAPFTAAPVKRGEARVKPGEPRPACAPIALGRVAGILDLAAAVGATEDAEEVLRAWAEGYAPVSELERTGELPAGLVGVQRAGVSWAALLGGSVEGEIGALSDSREPAEDGTPETG